MTYTHRLLGFAAIALLSNGTSSLTTRAAVPELVKDIYTATPPFEEIPGPGVFVGNELYFSASESAHGNELWKGDGTAAGSTLFKDINPGGGDSLPGLAGMLNVEGTVFLTRMTEFRARRSGRVTERWPVQFRSRTSILAWAVPCLRIFRW